jgi:asparagine synthase (glutamine-hydrolysing)
MNTADLVTNSRSYLGGMVRRRCFDNTLIRLDTSEPLPNPVVRHNFGDHELFLRVRPQHDQVLTRGRLSLLLRGYAIPADSRFCEAGIPSLLPALMEHYRTHQDLPIELLEGSFTVLLIDGEAGRLLVYRNIVGTGFTYYTQSPDGLVFGSNLADLVNSLPGVPAPNKEALPAYFLYRFVPGRETLFEDVFRLMPGEVLLYDGRQLQRNQRQTIGGLRGSRGIGRDPVDAVEEKMVEILADRAALDPHAVNLLSGGVDSSFIQVHWNKVRPDNAGAPATYTVSVNHPANRVDDDYAISAAKAFGTRHTLVPMDVPIATCLTETIARTGEPPNHMQSCYFRLLARNLAADGIEAAICGEGADSLFGVGQTAAVQMARLIRRAIPGRPLREFGAILAKWVGHARLPGWFRLADRLEHVGAWDHPLNQVAVFTDLDAVTACFGASGVTGAFALRRGLLDQYEIGSDLLDRVNFVGFLGEALDSGSLWATLFEGEGCEMFCPFLDSRMIRLVVTIDTRQRYPFRKPKGILKRALRRHAPSALVDRSKRGFGQPIFEWMGPGGQLRPLVEQIGKYDFLAADVLEASLRKPSWFLYSLLCYDLWHKFFIDRVVPESVATVLVSDDSKGLLP